VGSKEDAVEAAIRDQEQFRVKVIHGYKGDSNHRTTMTFIVEYADGDILEVPWSRDITSSWIRIRSLLSRLSSGGQTSQQCK